MSMHKFLKKFAFYHSAERVVGRGAILHPGPKSSFCHSPERVARFSWQVQHFEAHRWFLPQRGACSISGLRYLHPENAVNYKEKVLRRAACSIYSLSNI